MARPAATRRRIWLALMSSAGPLRRWIREAARPHSLASSARGGNSEPGRGPTAQNGELEQLSG